MEDFKVECVIGEPRVRGHVLVPKIAPAFPSLRDDMAMAALALIYTNQQGSYEIAAAAIAKAAYQIADAMLKEREK